MSPNLLPTHTAWAPRILGRCSSRPLTTRRPYSVVAALPRREHCQVPCRSNGSITIDLHGPHSQSSVCNHLTAACLDSLTALHWPTPPAPPVPAAMT
ncbi:hypothetical protein J1614_003630, partial [Plenodomus biglobosus]